MNSGRGWRKIEREIQVNRAVIDKLTPPDTEMMGTIQAGTEDKLCCIGIAES